MDPISAIGVATTAYNAIKKGFQVGKEIESMSKDLGRWMGAIQEVKEGHKKEKGRSFGSVEEEALESFASLIASFFFNRISACIRNTSFQALGP